MVQRPKRSLGGETIGMEEIILILHRTNAYLSILCMLIAGIFGIASLQHGQKQLSSSYKIILIAAEALIAAQITFGISLLISGFWPTSSLHIFIYGALSPLLLPGAYIYYKQHRTKNPNLIFGVVSLFLCAFLIRATFTS
jgi:hypothetical protein